MTDNSPTNRIVAWLGLASCAFGTAGLLLAVFDEKPTAFEVGLLCACLFGLVAFSLALIKSRQVP